MKIGLDLGNSRVKAVTGVVNGEETTLLKDELFIAWTKISKEEYDTTTDINTTVNKVKYKNEYYIVGEVGSIGISNKNKGNIEVAEYSNMIKLVSIARILKQQSLNECENITIVTGTPYDDFEMNENSYKNLMLSARPMSKETEEITVDDVEYKIKITNVDVTKQSACVIYTLPDRNIAMYIIWDLGGGTLDVSIFKKGVRINGKTLDFELNKIYEELGYCIGKYVEIDRPSMFDAIYQKTIEELLTTGKYKGVDKIIVDGKQCELANIAHEFMYRKFENIMNTAFAELSLTQLTLDQYNHVFVGGGAKSLKKEIEAFDKLKNKSIQVYPEYSNATAYYKIGKAKKYE